MQSPARLRQRADAVHELYVLAGRQDCAAARPGRASEAANVKVRPVDGTRLDALAGHGQHQGRGGRR
jgi:hypothetical protein